MSKQILDRKLKQILSDLKPYNPEKIILYGSCARGDTSKYSDIDLLIVKKTNKLFHHRIGDAQQLIYKKNTLEHRIFQDQLILLCTARMK